MQIEGVSQEVLDILMKYDFPGNVRELENFIEYAFILCHGTIIELDHLPKELSNGHKSREASEGEPSAKPLATSEQNTIITALDKHSWNRAATASYLSIHPSTLWRKMKKYSIKQG